MGRRAGRVRRPAAFRSDANRVIAGQDAEGATGRLWVLLLVVVGVGMLLLVVCFLAQVVGLLRLDAVPVVATLVMLGADLAGAAVSGSFWMPYLFVLIPPLALALALLLSNDRVRGTLDPGLDDLRSTLTGSNPPTWFVEASHINTWSELGTRPIESSLIRTSSWSPPATATGSTTSTPSTRWRSTWTARPPTGPSGESERRRATRRPPHPVWSGMEPNSA